MEHGIPTKYGFINFRSRLEARWAAFFDLCGWTWTYEPFDLPGWIPDFHIAGENGHEGVLVEVKPLKQLSEFRTLANEIGPSLNDDSFVLLLGTSPLWLIPGVDSEDSVVLGGSVVSPQEIYGGWQGDLQEFRSGTTNHPIDFCDVCGSWAGKLTGAYDGGHVTRPSRLHIERLWAEACNTTQWKAVTPR